MKGRNKRFINLRNQYLVKQYYLLYEIERKRPDDVVNELSEKVVFLDVKTIWFLLRQNRHLVKEIKRRKPTEKQLEDFQFTDKPEQQTPETINCGLFAMAV